LERSYTVTLITGDQVRLTEAGAGRYAATAVTGKGPAAQADFEAQGNPNGLTSLQAVPDEASALISTGQLDQGLFDVAWLAAHGDTGPNARIPVTIRYASRPAAALHRQAARLPGATVLATVPGSGEVKVSVAGGAAQVWLTGHQTPASASPRPQDGQPLYTVTETITRKTGPVDFYCGPLSGPGGDFVTTICPNIFPFRLWGVAGAGQEHGYRPNDMTCATLTPAKPYPVCTAWQVTFSVPAGVYAAHDYASFLTTDDPTERSSRRMHFWIFPSSPSPATPRSAWTRARRCR
jgi:hypothetical protein